MGDGQNMLSVIFLCNQSLCNSEQQNLNTRQEYSIEAQYRFEKLR